MSNYREQWFPLNSNESKRLQEDCDSLLSAIRHGADELEADCREQFEAHLKPLLKKYRNHPFLLELKADFSPLQFADDSDRRILAYQVALQQARAWEFPTHTVLMSLAKNYLWLLGDYESAMESMEQARHDLELYGCEREEQLYKKIWGEIWEEVILNHI